MESQSLRIRLIFDDCSVLNLSQRSHGMNHSWTLIEPNQHPKISDVCTHLLHKFNLRSSCPNGILLSMEGFVLPPSESTRIMKDNDIICVKRKGVALAEAIEGADACNVLNEEVNRREPVDNGMLLLANEEFDKETGGYQSEFEDAELEKSKDDPSPKETTSKKRKASAILRSSKKKKHRLIVTDGVEDEVAIEDCGIDIDECIPMKISNKKIKPNKKKRSGESETVIKEVKSSSKVKRKKKHLLGVVIADEDEAVTGELEDVNNGESVIKKKISKKKTKPSEEIKMANAETSDKDIQDDVKGVKQMSTAPDGKKKHSSRSVIADEDEAVTGELEDVNNGESVIKKKISKKKTKPSEEIKMANAETSDEDIQDDVKGVKQMSTAPDGKKKHSSRSVIADEDEAVTGELEDVNNGESVIKKKISKKKTKPSEEINMANAETSDKDVKDDVEGVKQTSTAPDRKKKHRLGSVIGDEDEAVTGELEDVNNGESVAKKKIGKKKIKPNEEIKMANAESSDNDINDGVGVKQTSTALDGGEKVPSRSTRRKKAKRKWRRELAKSSENPETHVEPEISKETHVEPEVSKETHVEPEISKIEIKEASGHLKQDQVVAKVTHKNTIEQEGRNHDENGVTNLVPFVIRPGHIRFEPLDEDEDAMHTELPDVAFQWNGITSKKKGQKWGLEKISTSKRDDSQKPTEEPAPMLTAEAQAPLVDLNAFDQLPLCSSPKEGDVIAYRVLELSSSWTPELSSFRVGKISHYDAENIVLMPVPEYPIVFDKMDENGPENSLYKEDGSLEIKFAELSDLRSLEQRNPDAVKAVSNGGNQTAQVDEKNSASNLVSSSNNDENVSKDPSPVVGNTNTEGNNAWDEIKELLSAKKSELLETNDETKQDSGWNKWSYRALRGSALGPTISLLRSKNDI